MFMVQYTDADGVEGEIEVEAPNAETAYEMFNAHYPGCSIDFLFKL